MDSFYAFALTFASEHWFLTWCVLWLVWLPALLPIQIIKIAHSLIIRTYRLIMVSLRGWPPAHLDADGDWRPEKTDS